MLVEAALTSSSNGPVCSTVEAIGAYYYNQTVLTIHGVDKILIGEVSKKFPFLGHGFKTMNDAMWYNNDVE